MGNKRYCLPCKFNKENNLDPAATLFKFPTSPKRRQLWRNKLQISENYIGLKSRVCEHHFDRKQFVRTRLRAGAIPSSPSELRPPPKKLFQKSIDAQPNVIVLCPILNVVDNSNNAADQFNTSSTSSIQEPELNEASSLRTCKRRLSDIENRYAIVVAENARKVDLERDLSTDPKFLKFVQTQVQRYQNPRLPYSPWEKSVGLSLFYSCGRKGYSSLLQLGCKLPALSTIRGWMKEFKFFPGINAQLLELIHQHTEDMDIKDKDCVLMWDEMAIKEFLLYNKSEDMFEGLIDHGAIGRELSTASEVMVFMVQGIHSSWKFPLSFYFSKNSTTAEVLKQLLFENIAALESIGLKIRVGICDMSFCNQALYRNLGITLDKTYIERHGYKIKFAHDSTHLAKLARNNLMKHDIEYTPVTGGTERKLAKWPHIVSFFKKDSRVPSRLAPKLTTMHIFLKDFAKMRVKLAVQVLSHSVYAGIKALCDLQLLKAEAMETAEFVKTIDEIFDFLNISKVYDSKYSRSAKYFDDHISKVDDYIEFFQLMTLPYSNRHSEFIYGFLLTLTVVKNLAIDLKCEGYSYILTRRIQQDPLENFFAEIRMKGGFCKNPTAYQFRINFRYLFFTKLMKISESGRNTECLEDDNFFNEIDKVSSSIGVKHPDSNFRLLKNKKIASEFYSVKVNSKLKLGKEQEDLVAIYIGGASVRAIVDSKDCNNCKEHLTIDDEQKSLQQFIKLKEYWNGDDKLVYLNTETRTFFEYVNSHFLDCAVTSLSISGRNILKNIYDKLYLNEIVKRWIDFGNCDKPAHRKLILEYFLRSKIYRLVKDANTPLQNHKSFNQNRRDLRHR